MFTVDRDASTPVSEQIVEQIRYFIASGRYGLDETLPSTRKLAEQVDVSFHTVRKAYQQLQDEGLVDAQPGSGYVVIAQSTLSKSERMERGATVVRETVQRLIGLGLSNAEMEYLYQEQLSMLDFDRQTYKLLVVTNFRELSLQCADQLTDTLQQVVDPVGMDDLAQHADADFVFAPYPLLKTVQPKVPRADVIGFAPQLEGTVLERVARLLDHETLGLIVRYSDAIQYLSQWIKRETGFSGNLMAVTAGDESDQLRAFIQKLDHVVYTSASQPRVTHLLASDRRHGRIDFKVPAMALDSAKKSIPS